MKKLFLLFSALAFSLVANAANFPDVYVTGTSKFDGKITNIFLSPSRVLVTGTDKSLASVGTTGLITGAGTAAGASDVTTALGYTPLTNTAAAITNALGYVPVNKSGDTMTGTLGFSGTSTLLNLPSLTTAQKNAATAVAGSQVYDSDLGRVQMYDGAAWHSRVRLDGDTMTGGLGIISDIPLALVSSTDSTGPRFARVASNKWQVQTGAGSHILEFALNGIGFGIASSTLAIGSTISTADCILVRDAANTLALRNGAANAQLFRIYNTYTDSSNFERARVGWSGNVFYVSAGGSGTGVQRAVKIGTDGVGALTFYTDSTDRWQFSSGGHLLAVADNTYDIGANGATRPRTIYTGTHIIAGSSLFFGGGANYIQGSGGGKFKMPSDGVFLFTNNAENDVSRIQLGGTTASFPAIRRNGTGLDVRLADDSNYGVLNAPNQQSGYTKVCTSASSNALFYVSVPNTNMIGGRVLYTVNSTDGTDAQQITGTAQFGAVGKGTAVTANVTDVQNTSTVSAGTLTASLTANVSTNNVFALMVTPTTSLTTTNLTVKWRLETPSTYTVNPL